jgi:DNA invertase Pin-like site-specific DNA recombinase
MARPDPSRGTSTAAGKCLLDMLGIFADFETNLRRERQLEGIAKAAGVYKGRKPSIDTDEVGRLKNEGHGAAEIAKRLNWLCFVYRVFLLASSAWQAGPLEYPRLL